MHTLDLPTQKTFHSTNERWPQKKIRAVLPVFTLLLIFLQQVSFAKNNVAVNLPVTLGVDKMADVPIPRITVVNHLSSSTLSTKAKGSLRWNTGETTSSITVRFPSSYSVTQTVHGITSKPGYAFAAPKIFVESPEITVKNECGSSTLSTTAKGSLRWNTGDTTSSITVHVAYNYSVTQTINGITSPAGFAFAKPRPVPPIPEITVINKCDSSILSTTALGKLVWSTGATGTKITVSTPGSYTVTRTANGCTSAEGSAMAVPKVIPAAPKVVVTNYCGSSVLSTTAKGKLTWSTGLTLPAIPVSSPGTYTVKQTVNGCTSEEGSGIAAPLEQPAISFNFPGINPIEQGGGIPSPENPTQNPGNFTPDPDDPSIQLDELNVDDIFGICAKSVAFKPKVVVTGTTASNVVYKIGSQVITSPYLFPVGSTIVAVTATNSCGTTAKKFVVNVRENQKPSIVCHANLIKTLEHVDEVAYIMPGTTFNATASDNCGIPSLTYRLTGATILNYSDANTSLKGQSFNTGSTVITWKATDASGNSATCRTSVKIISKAPIVPPPVWKDAINPSAASQTTEDKEPDLIKFNVKVMPNPSSNIFTLKLSSKEDEPFKITVSDVTGRIIEQKTGVPSQGLIQFGSNYLPGIYIADIKQGKQKVTIKLFKTYR